MKRASIPARVPFFASIVFACANANGEGDDGAIANNEAFRIIDGPHAVGPVS